MTTFDAQEVLHLLNRRSFIAGSAALAAVPLMPWKALALSTAPFTFTQGDAEITVFSDGSLTLPLTALAPDASPEQLAEIAKRLGGPADGSSHPATNIPLVKIGSDLIIVDVGSGNKFQPTAGRLSENLAAAGIDPAS